MLPVFQTILPEGYPRDHRDRFGKVMRTIHMLRLGENSIGRLRLSRQTAPNAEDSGVESLGEIPSDQGSRNLFEYLSDVPICSGSGVQPKVMLAADEARRHDGRFAFARQGQHGEPARGNPSSSERRRLSRPDGERGHCLAIARARAHRVLMLARKTGSARSNGRFDRASGRYLGFETWFVTGCGQRAEVRGIL
jgi:hypothetical protein